MNTHEFMDAQIERSTQGAQKATAPDYAALSNDELRRQLTDCRSTLESIFPYKCRDISAKQAALRAELTRRASKPKKSLWQYATEHEAEHRGGMQTIFDYLAAVHVTQENRDDVRAAWDRYNEQMAQIPIHTPLTCPRCAKPTAAFGLCAECAKTGGAL